MVVVFIYKIRKAVSVQNSNVNRCRCTVQKIVRHTEVINEERRFSKFRAY